MKLKITILTFFTFLLFGGYAHAQTTHPVTTNNGMEIWIDFNQSGYALHRPDQWYGSDQIIAQFKFLAAIGNVTLTPKVQVNKSSDFHTGSLSAEIFTENVGSVGVQPGIMGNSPLSIDFTKVDVNNLGNILGALSFAGGETLNGTKQVARVYAWLKRGAIHTDNYVVDAIGYMPNGDTTSIGHKVVTPDEIPDWTMERIDLTPYNGSTGIPTRLVVTFASSDFSGATMTEGNSLLVDDVVYQYSDEEALPIDDINEQAILNNNDVTITWNASIKDNIGSYTVQHSLNGKDWKDVSDPFDQITSNHYQFKQYALDAGNHFYRLKVNLLTGGVDYSNVMRVNVKLTAAIKVWPNPVTNGEVHLAGIPQGAGISVYSASGQAVLSTNNTDTHTDLDLSRLSTGVYILRVVDGSGQQLFTTQVVKK